MDSFEIILSMMDMLFQFIFMKSIFCGQSIYPIPFFYVSQLLLKCFTNLYHNILYRMFHVKHKYRVWKTLPRNVSRETLICIETRY